MSTSVYPGVFKDGIDQFNILVQAISVALHCHWRKINEEKVLKVEHYLLSIMLSTTGTQSNVFWSFQK